MERIIIDCDPGIDDTFAILLAAHSNNLSIEAITTVAGNCDLDKATNNTFKILNLVNKDNIPVYKGMDKALKVKHHDASYVHGNNGIGGVQYTPINRKAEDLHAVDYLIETVNTNPSEITIVAIGPLTNIASAILKNSEFCENVKKLIIMGGSIDIGNVTPDAEFNFYKDPDAAKIVFEANFNDITMMGLDITTKLPLNKRLEDILQSSQKPLANFLFEITRICAKHNRSGGFDGALLHDPITIAYLNDPTIVEVKPAIVNIEITGDKIGKSTVTFVEKSNCKVGYEVDSEKFYKQLFKKILNINI